MKGGRTVEQRHDVILPHVVWDVGGTLFRHFTELIVEYGRSWDWPLDRLPLGPTGETPDPRYQRLLDGDLDDADYTRLLVEELEANGIDHDPFRDLSWRGRERKETWRTIEHLHRAGHRQALLTNDASKWLGEDWWREWPAAPWFDVVIDVITIGVRKPAPEPYQAVAAALGAPPRDCLFVDDSPANCRGAEAVGMKSHRFDIADPDGSLELLEARLGLDARLGRLLP